jgi:demethoxyubiquinone hydroxylase (CLK1/Coq7/Cat5 family)
MANPRDKDIDQLNSFLRGELSAVETYNQAIQKLANEPAVVTSLQQSRASHVKRCDMLRAEIRRLGGEPADGSGMWGGFAKLVEGGASVFGKKAAVAALEEGEDHGQNDYKRDLDELSPQVRMFVQSQLVPEQQRTHDVLSQLKRQM